MRTNRRIHTNNKSTTQKPISPACLNRRRLQEQKALLATAAAAGAKPDVVAQAAAATIHPVAVAAPASAEAEPARAKTEPQPKVLSPCSRRPVPPHSLPPAQPSLRVLALGYALVV